jgi:hypothetical protein
MMIRGIKSGFFVIGVLMGADAGAEVDVDAGGGVGADADSGSGVSVGVGSGVDVGVNAGGGVDIGVVTAVTPFAPATGL